MTKSKKLVSIVDDDESVRESLPDLLGQLGFDTRTFSSGDQFLASGLIEDTSCLLLDIAMPDMSGPELQRELRRRGSAIPIVFITASRDMTVRARLVADGAAEVLFKPFSEAALLDALNLALGMR